LEGSSSEIDAEINLSDEWLEAACDYARPINTGKLKLIPLTKVQRK